MVFILCSEFKHIEWSCSGAYLAVLTKASDLLLWDPVKGLVQVETGMKGLERILWSPDDEMVRLLCS
jgi:hypothetical protein